MISKLNYIVLFKLRRLCAGRVFVAIPRRTDQKAEASDKSIESNRRVVLCIILNTRIKGDGMEFTVHIYFLFILYLCHANIKLLCTA